jgi:altronate dehydratase small subunit
MESSKPDTRAVRIHAADNVATLLDDAAPGSVRILGTEPLYIFALEVISAGHKIALGPITTDESVMKYGFPIGHAVRDIAAGEWVHLHNLASNYDERSSTLDLETGAPTDTGHAYR